MLVTPVHQTLSASHLPQPLFTCYIVGRNYSYKGESPSIHPYAPLSIHLSTHTCIPIYIHPSTQHIITGYAMLCRHLLDSWDTELTQTLSLPNLPAMGQQRQCTQASLDPLVPMCGRCLCCLLHISSVHLISAQPWWTVPRTWNGTRAASGISLTEEQVKGNLHPRGQPSVVSLSSRETALGSAFIPVPRKFLEGLRPFPLSGN